MSGDSEELSEDRVIESASEKAVEDMNEARQEQPEVEEAELEAAEVGDEEPDCAAEAAEWKGKYLREVAALENFRKRTQRDKERWTADAVRSMATDLIDVLDNLDMALATVGAEAVPGAEFVTGVTMVRSQLDGALRRRSIERIAAAEGDAFDPDAHAALMMEVSEEVEGEQIGAILRPGYRLKDMILRPVQVKVLKGAPRPADAN